MIDACECPADRKVHKMVWVYKRKRPTACLPLGECKGRLCVQGVTMMPGVDYDQVQACTLRSDTGRCIFAYAAKHGCRLRSVDWVAAYLQDQGKKLQSKVLSVLALRVAADPFKSVKKMIKDVIVSRQATKRTIKFRKVHWFKHRTKMCFRCRHGAVDESKS